MLVSFNWLKEYLDLSEISPAELTEKFTLGGLEVEATEKLGANLDHLVVGEVLMCEPIEESDYLMKTTVDIGEETLPIVCGAPNVKAGQKVVVAEVGAVLPGGLEIEETTLMGEPSVGMIVSLDELGFSDSIIPARAEDGIYILDSDAKVGADARPYLGLDDTVYEFDLTPNRADALSMRGVAHEVGALIDQTPQFDDVTVTENTAENVADYMSIDVEKPADTPVYKMRLVKDVTIGKSPLWMQHKLIHAGIRPIDLVVDITNYVMLEFGQPLHAFDYDKLTSDHIYVRRATENEKLTTLDNQERTLNDDNLVITNGEKPVALAGVMGGANSQITEETQTIAIEAAVFHPVLIRRTANRLNLRSEASNRYEKGINLATVQAAADLAAQLMQELGGGKIISGTAESINEEPEDVQVSTTTDKVNGLMGTDLTDDTIASILDRLGFEHTLTDGQIEAYIPPRRWDIKLPEDLVEEIARIYGYNNIPISLPVTESTPGELTQEQKMTRDARGILEGNGLQEAISYSLTTTEKAVKYAIIPGDSVSLQNPASEERVTLRQNLVSGLIDDAAYNRAHQVADIAQYEIGNVFYKQGDNDFIEYSHIAGLLTGERPANWLKKEEALDFYTIKGMVETLLSAYSFSDAVTYQLASDRNGMHPGRTADIYLGDELLGYVGQLHPNEASTHDLEDTYVFELSLDQLVQSEKETIEYNILNRYPGSSRDIALLVDQEVTHQELEAVIVKHGGNRLQEVTLFDLYAGDNIEEGKKSMAYSLYYVDPKATLKEEEINDDFERVKEALVDTFEVEIR